MRIIAVCGFAWEPKGTARSRAFPILAELAAKGHDVTLLTIPYDNPGLSGQEIVRDGVLVKALDLHTPLLRLATIPRRAVREIYAMSPDLVHVFKPKGYAGAIAWMLLRQGRIPVCVDCDDWEGWGGWNELKPYPLPVKAYIDWQEKWITRKAHSITVASRTLLDRAQEIGQFRERIFYAPNCVTASQFSLLGETSRRDPKEARQELGLPDKPVILYTGHFEPVDDVIFFCRAVAPALRDGASLALIGDGFEMGKLREYFAGINLGASVHHYGRLPYNKYLDVLAASNITCFPYPDNSVYHSKCSARIVDYMGAAKPVVTTNIGQNPEYIENGKSGILVDPGSASQFRDALTVLLKHEDLCKRIGAAARQRICDFFQWSSRSVLECEHAYRIALDRFAEVNNKARTSNHPEVFTDS